MRRCSDARSGGVFVGCRSARVSGDARKRRHINNEYASAVSAGACSFVVYGTGILSGRCLRFGLRLVLQIASNTVPERPGRRLMEPRSMGRIPTGGGVPRGCRGSARVSGGGAGSERWSVRGDRGAGRERPARDGVRMSGAGYAGAAVGGCGDRSSGRAGQEAGRCRRCIGRAGGGSGAWPVGRRSDGCGTLRAAGSRTGGGAIRALRNRAVGRAGVGGISGGSGRVWRRKGAGRSGDPSGNR